MQALLLALALVLACVSRMAAAHAGAVELTADNFDSLVGSKSSFVMFKAPWCGHCKRLTPTWDELANEVNNDHTMVGYVDCTVHEALCSKYSVTGYPTLKVFDQETGLTGKPYEGSRDKNDLKKYIEENLSKACNVATPNDGGCNAKQIDYINKMKAATKTDVAEQLVRLQNMKGSTMAPENKKWLLQRIGILQQLQ